MLAGTGTAGPSSAADRRGPAGRASAPATHLIVEADARQHGGVAALEVLLLGGRPIREPVVLYGPFVMNTREEILQAIEDFQSGRMGAIPATRA